MSFKQPYQQATKRNGKPGKMVHRASRKDRPSATYGFLKPERYLASKRNPLAPGPA